MDVDLGVAVSEDSVALAGFPFAHKFSSFEAKKTYLYWVAETNYVEAAKWLLNNGVAIAPNGYHRTSPLIVSIENGHLGMVRLLAENGADVNGGRVGPCPLELAMGIKETQLKQRMVELLEGYGAKYYASSSRHC